jgi:FkbM family methyltransferase
MTQVLPPPPTNRLWNADFGLSLHPQKHAFFPKSIHYAKALRNLAGASFTLSSADELLAHLGPITVQVQTEEDLYILMEIHVEGSYNLHSSRPAIVLDIGMNVGFASLVFAAMPNVQQVISFEPFPATFEQALVNFRLNPALHAKITPTNVGIGATSRTLSLEYCDAWRGSMGIDGVPNALRTGNQFRQETVQLRSVSEILSLPALNPVENTDLIAKIDCEGAEYEILDALSAAGALPRFKIIMLEWHRKGPAPLLQQLDAAGFMLLSHAPHSKGTGMLYAFRH